MGCRLPLRAMPAIASLALGCGGALSSSEPNATNDDGGAAGGGDASLAFDASGRNRPDARSDARSEPGPCDAAPDGRAPNGGPCDPTRIVVVHRGTPACAFAKQGDFCDELQVSVPIDQEARVPPGFVCGSRELGVAICRWVWPDTSHRLDAAAIDAACAFTAAFPSATVSCIIHD